MAAPLAYFDTSVLVKQYLREPGSIRARALLRVHRLLSSVLTPLEAISALGRRRADGDVGERDFAAIMARMRLDRAYWELVEVTEPVLSRAEALIERRAVRTLDAIHVASAVTVQGAFRAPLPFVTADARQREVAQAEALEVIWVS